MDSVRLILDEFFSRYLDCDLTKVSPGRVVVVPSDRRDQPEINYQNTFAIYLIATGNRCVISVQHKLETPVRNQVNRMSLGEFHTPRGQQQLINVVAHILGNRNLLAGVAGPILFITSHCIRLHKLHHCRQITLTDIPSLSTAGLYGTYLDHSIKEGTCYAAFDKNQPVSVAGTWQVPHLADKVAEMCVPGTIPSKRREGYGKTALSYATHAVLKQNKIPIYITSERNIASIATARSVGFQPYGWQFRVEILPETEN